jgi:hypothetical protein
VQSSLHFAAPQHKRLASIERFLQWKGEFLPREKAILVGPPIE